MAGVTETGFEAKTLQEILADIGARQRDRISENLDVSEATVLGNVNAIVADQLSEVWEALQVAYFACDPDNATDDQYRAIALLTGVQDPGPQKGIVVATVNLDAATTIAAGELVANVLGEADNRWENRDAFTSAGAGDYELTFLSEDAGATFVAAAGTLTEISAPVTGWNSVTNVDDATPGRDFLTINELRVQREASLAASGANTLASILADVVAVDGVISAQPEENTADIAVGGLPAHSFQITIWDGASPAADDDAIAQAILDSRPPGIESVGSQSGSAVDPAGNPAVVNFGRAVGVDIWIEVDIEAANGSSADDIVAALLAAGPEIVGGDVVYNKLAAAPFTVAGVDDWSTLTVGATPAPAGTVDVAIAPNQIALLDAARITVTGDAS